LIRKEFTMTHSVSWTLQDAKARFSQVVAAAVRGQVQRVTKHGKEAVVVVSAAEYAAWKSGRVTAPTSFVDHLLAMPRPAASKAGAAKGARTRRGAPARARIVLRKLDLP
jgi:antitoxin Phd